MTKLNPVRNFLKAPCPTPAAWRNFRELPIHLTGIALEQWGKARFLPTAACPRPRGETYDTRVLEQRTRKCRRIFTKQSACGEAKRKLEVSKRFLLFARFFTEHLWVTKLLWTFGHNRTSKTSSDVMIYPIWLHCNRKKIYNTFNKNRLVETFLVVIKYFFYTAKNLVDSVKCM